MKFSFCLEMFYTEVPFIDRLKLAKNDGISFFEFWDWRNKDLNALKQQMKLLKMQVLNISGNRNYGMIDPDERDHFLGEVRETGAVAKDLGCPTLMLLVQSLENDGGGRLPSIALENEEIVQNIINCGKEVGKIADELKLNIVIEPLNVVLDHPRYVLNASGMAFDIIQAIDHPRVKVLYDIYHMAMQDENIPDDIEDNFEYIGYFHAADKPGRFEPGSGEIEYPKIFSLLTLLNYQGTVGFECLPSHGDSHQAVRRIFESFQK